MNVLAISSHVAYGHVGNSAAVFALQRLGIEAWPINTVAYSNHPGHGRYRGVAASGAEIAEIVPGLTTSARSPGATRYCRVTSAAPRRARPCATPWRWLSVGTRERFFYAIR